MPKKCSESEQFALDSRLACFCSARLQAGISLIAKCPSEGGRYRVVPQSSSENLNAISLYYDL
jgi:hypothetical protein